MADEKKGLDLGELAHNLFLAGVGAAAIAGEKVSDVADDLVKKGKLTVEQGKAVNQELSQKASDAVAESTASMLKAQMAAMTPEQREKFVERVRKMADDVEAKAAEANAKTEEAVDDAAEDMTEDVEDAAIDPDDVE